MTRYVLADPLAAATRSDDAYAEGHACEREAGLVATWQSLSETRACVWPETQPRGGVRIYRKPRQQDKVESWNAALLAALEATQARNRHSGLVPRRV
jgi:hypothetical protein